MRDLDPTVMPTTNRPGNAGTSMDDDASRLDGIPKIDGSARYGRDVYPKDVLFARFIRCPWGSATLTSANEDAAKAVPGVVEIRIDSREANYHGRPIGIVCADSMRGLDRAMRALDMQWAIRESSRGVPDETFVDPAEGDMPEAMKAADATIEAVYTTAVQTHSAIETHGAVVEARPNGATAWISTQGVQGAGDGIARALEIPRSSTEVIADYVGGGFGAKLGGAGKEGVAAAQLSRKHGRPVWLFCDRVEEHLDTGNRPDSRTFVRMGARRDGTILGAVIRSAGTSGVGRRGGGVSIPSGNYDLGDVDRDHRDIQSNHGSPRPFRAPGKPQGSFAEELAIDELASAIGMDPLEFRRRNETSEPRKRMYDVGAERIGWSNRAADGAGAGVLVTGYGMGSTGWPAFPSRSEAEVVINPDGSVLVRQGAQDIGTGHRTAIGILTADTLGIPLNRVTAETGRSTLPLGPASGGSVTLTNVAPSVQAAAEKALERLYEVLADREGGDTGEFSVFEGRILRSNEPFATWEEACRMLPQSVQGGGSHGGRGGRRGRGAPGTGHSDGVQFAKVTVDRETGVVTVDTVVAVQACGRIVSRKATESQIIGGVIQGVSYALFEQRVLDRNSGAMVNPNMEWYRILGSKDMPHIEPVLWDDGATGVRPLGEPPTIPTAGAIACAVRNALGVTVRHLPLAPHQVLAALAGGGAA